jgi:enoyl-[acyl-carrier protein] reductase II
VTPTFDNRITRMLGVSIPILNAPMGVVANPRMVAAVAGAGAIGLAPGSMGAAYIRQFIRDLAPLTNRPFGVNIPIQLSDPRLHETLLAEGVRLVTTSTGPVPDYVGRLQASGARVFHVVASLEEARLAAAAGVDGLIVESAEGAGLRGRVSMMVLLPLITSQIDLPVIAAGGITDGVSMAAAFALGAEGVQMGTRMLASEEASVHDGLKQAVVEAAETDTLLLDRHKARQLRVLRTPTTAAYEFADGGDAFGALIGGVGRVYKTGELEGGFASVGEGVGRIEAVLPVAEIIRRTVEEFGAVVARMGRDHLRRG